VGKRGPPAKPSAIKKREGTYRKDRAAPNELKVPPEAPDCPKYLDNVARKMWQHVVPRLIEAGVLAKIDTAALEGFCANYSQAVRSQKIADRQPYVDTAFGIKVHPAVGNARKAWALTRQFAAEFGLTPAARTRVSVPENDAGDADDDFMFGGLRSVQGGKSGRPANAPPPPPAKAAAPPAAQADEAAGDAGSDSDDDG
jgi:P27 family predicted phage terminase small subunit